MWPLRYQEQVVYRPQMWTCWFRSLPSLLLRCHVCTCWISAWFTILQQFCNIKFAGIGGMHWSALTCWSHKFMHVSHCKRACFGKHNNTMLMKIWYAFDETFDWDKVKYGCTATAAAQCLLMSSRNLPSSYEYITHDILAGEMWMNHDIQQFSHTCSHCYPSWMTAPASMFVATT